jgi:hypothetical protein
MSERTDATRGERPANVFDPSYDAKQFKRDMTSGQLRWLATILWVANAGLLVYEFIFSSGEPEMHFPVRLKGSVVLWLLSVTFLIWSSLAFVNWKNWAAKRRGGVSAR